MPVETDLIPYKAASHIPAKNVIVFAPHADDEVFGCGGAILSCVNIGIPVSVVILTDGGRYGDPSERMRESHAAAIILGYGEPEFWCIGDRTLYQEKNLVERFAQKILETGADLVFAPSPWEIHPDHRRTATAALDAVCRTGIRIAFYEVGSPLPPNFLLNITPHVDVKKKAMLCFNSQLKQQNYGDQISALNQYRTYTLSSEVTGAEAYLLLASAEIATNLPEMLIRRPVSLGAMPSWNATSEISPLVSILILSANSEYLQETLDSISLQTYPWIEVVVISADSKHQLVPSRCGPFEMRLISTDMPLSRSQIANKGLLAVRGSYFLIIDDGDWLLPEHIAKLIYILKQQSYCMAIYSCIALSGNQGEPLGQVTDFLSNSASRLFGGLKFIHSILFDKKILSYGYQFDEKLDGFEDLDFLLQVSLQTRFLYFPCVSAVCRLRDTSYAEMERNAYNLKIKVIYNKWASSWHLGRCEQLMPNKWLLDNAAQELMEKEKIIHEAENNIKIQTLTINRQITEISTIINSCSWKLTAPLRWLLIIIKRKNKKTSAH